MLWVLLEKIVMGMLNISAQAAVIFCVLFLVRGAFSLCRVPKKYACFLWLILFVRLLMPVQPESPVGLWIKGATQPFQVENPNDLSHRTDAVGEKLPAPEEVYGTGSIMEPAEKHGSESVPALVVRPVLCAVWITGCLGFLSYGGISSLLLRKKLQCCIKSEENCYLVDGIPSAFIMGFFPPRIYLPSELGEDDLSYVILHERIHIKRKDYLIKMTAYLITCFYWFHPLVWAALILLGRDIEMSCDEAVLGNLGEGSRQGYADTLLRLSAGRRYFAGAPLAFGEGDTGSRMKHIIRYRKPVRLAAVTAVILIIMLTAGLLTGRPTVEGGGRSGDDGSAGTLLRDGGGTSEPDSVDMNIVQPSAGQFFTELPSGHIVAISDKTAVAIDGEVYDMAELCESVNGVMPEVRELDRYIVVKGHISPDNSYYGFFNTEKRQWEWGLIGGLLTWDENWETRESPVESVIYAESGDNQGVICDWKGNMIAVFDLDHEFVYDLKRVGDDITITIINEAVEERELSFDFKDSFHTLYHW